MDLKNLLTFVIWQENEDTWGWEIVEYRIDEKGKRTNPNKSPIAGGYADNKYAAEYAACVQWQARLQAQHIKAVTLRHLRPETCFKFHGEF